LSWWKASLERSPEEEELESQAGDAIKVLRHVVGLKDFDRVQKQVANVSGVPNGEVNESDAIEILRYVVGLEDKLSVKENGE